MSYDALLLLVLQLPLLLLLLLLWADRKPNTLHLRAVHKNEIT
jgi:hypothetical protein